MKTKGLNAFEGVIEKVVLALALVIFLGVFALQFLGSPTVDLPGVSEPVPIAQATDEVAESARSKIAQLQDVRVPVMPPPPNLGTELAARFNGPVFEQPTQIAGLVPGWDAIEGIDAASTDVIVTGENEYAVPTPVAPGNTVAAVLTGTVDPSIPLLYPEAADLLPEEQPMDKAFVSVQVDWDAAANRARMAESLSDDQLPLPQEWRTNMEIWDVELVRRQLGSDGQWGAETVVPPLPGRASLRERLADATPPDISVIVSEEQSLRAGIRQPRMYNLIAGDFWAAPVEFVASNEIERPEEVERLLRQVRRIQSEIDGIQRQLDNLGGGGGGGGGAGGGGRGSILPQMPDRIFDLDGINPDSIRWPQFADSARRRSVAAAVAAVAMLRARIPMKPGVAPFRSASIACRLSSRTPSTNSTPSATTGTATRSIRVTTSRKTSAQPRTFPRGTRTPRQSISGPTTSPPSPVKPTSTRSA
ncbi:MAG: hypothetical protein ACFHWZ_06355 [Phycisphaerales bacterium]